MPLDPAFVGRSYPAPEPYEVAIEKVRQFADAIGDDNPLYHDRVAATRAGHPNVVAPPTFAITVIAEAQSAVIFDPALGLDFARVVHGDQRFVHHRAIHAGDVLSSTVHIDTIRNVAGNDFLGLRIEVADADGAPVVTAYGTLVARGEQS